MRLMFAPGCGLMLYKPELAARLLAILNDKLGGVEELSICCRNHPALDDGTKVINICPGCDRRYRENYENASTVSLWEVPAPAESSPEQIEVWTQVITGMELDTRGAVRALDGPTWRKRRQRLEELGGAPSSSHPNRPS